MLEPVSPLEVGGGGAGPFHGVKADVHAFVPDHMDRDLEPGFVQDLHDLVQLLRPVERKGPFAPQLALVVHQGGPGGVAAVDGELPASEGAHGVVVVVVERHHLFGLLPRVDILQDVQADRERLLLGHVLVNPACAAACRRSHPAHS